MKAALVLSIKYDCCKHLVLAVRRSGSQNSWGLPGGIVNQGEDLKQAALRKLISETGLHYTISPRGDEWGCDQVASGDVTVYCVQSQCLSGTLSDAAEWIDARALLEQNTSPFWWDNRWLFASKKVEREVTHTQTDSWHLLQRVCSGRQGVLEANEKSWRDEFERGCEENARYRAEFRKYMSTHGIHEGKCLGTKGF